MTSRLFIPGPSKGTSRACLALTANPACMLAFFRERKSLMAWVARLSRSRTRLVLREERELVRQSHAGGGPARPRQRHKDVRRLREQEAAVRLRHEIAPRQLHTDGLREEDR